jgi:acetyl-CoA carboxylase biotin carboxyl carrier protein
MNARNSNINIEEDEDISFIKKTYDFMCNENLIYLEVKIKNGIIKIKRYEEKEPAMERLLSSLSTLPAAARGAQAEKQIQTKEEKQTYMQIRAPLTGTFYRSPAPNHPPFVEKGQVVEKGQILCIIEAMKVMNEIPAPLRCKIEDILAENGSLVNTEQELFLVTPM